MPPPATPLPIEEPPLETPSVTRWTVIGLGVMIAVIVAGLILAVVGALFGESDKVANFFRILRDFFIIVLAVQGILISIALIILVLQVSALITLLRTEIKPIVDETRQTMSTIRGTAQFVSKNVASPIIRTSAAVSGVLAVFREVTQIRKNLGGGKKP
jgi:hypothetical protein